MPERYRCFKEIDYMLSLIHILLECNKEKLIVGPRKGFASYVNSKLNENGMNPVTEKELLENRIDFNEHKIPHVEFVEFPEEMRSQYLLLSLIHI